MFWPNMSLNIQNKNILVIPTPVYKTHVKHCMNGAQSDLVTSHVRPIEKVRGFTVTDRGTNEGGVCSEKDFINNHME